MGRRRKPCGSATDPLPAMVRHKNAVNAELTLAAKAEDVWAAVESGRERRRRLACERSYGLHGVSPTPLKPVTSPGQVEPVAAVATEPVLKRNDKAAEQQPVQRIGAPSAQTPEQNQQDKENTPVKAKKDVPVPAVVKEVKPTPEPTPAKVKASVKSVEAARVSAPPESKAPKKNKQKAQPKSESEDTSPPSAPEQGEASLATSLSQMVSEEDSVVTLPSPPPDIATPSVPIPLSCLSYADKVKILPASSPPPKEPSPPPRPDSPEPLYDPTPRARTPPPNLPVSPTSSCSLDWQPVESRREKRARRRSERMSESERKSESSTDVLDPTISSGDAPQQALHKVSLDEEPAVCDATKPEDSKNEVAVVEQDAFDLLLSGANDLTEGFQEAFGDESPASTAVPESVPQTDAPDADAFDLLMGGDDDLQAGFNEAFEEDTELVPVIKEGLDSMKSVNTTQDKRVSKVQSDKIKPDKKFQNSDSEKPVVKTEKGKPRSRKTSEKTTEVDQHQPLEPNAFDDGDPSPVVDAGSVAWFDKAGHDAAEEQFYHGHASECSILNSDMEQNGLKKTSAKPAQRPLSLSGAELPVETIQGSQEPSRIDAEASQAVSAESQLFSRSSQPQSLSTQPITTQLQSLSTQAQSPSTEPQTLSTEPQSLSTEPQSLNTEPQSLGTQPRSLFASSMSQSFSSQPTSLSSQAVSLASQPMSLASQPDLYYEDVVLPCRQGSTTMATLPGFLAQPVSERLAPGEELESLRTEPELEPDESIESTKQGKNNRTKRRRRRSERVSESERRRGPRTSESDSCSAAVPPPSAAPAGQELSDTSECHAHEVTTTSQNGKKEKEQHAEGGSAPEANNPPKTGKPRQRRKKTKSSTSISEPVANGEIAKDISPPRTDETVGSAATKAVTNDIVRTPANIPAAPVDSPGTTSTAPLSSQSACLSSPSTAGSEPSSPEHGPSLRPDDKNKKYASLMQQDEDMLPARPVFLAHACFVCKRLHSKQCRLKSCGSCRLVAYCSAEHQRAHWPLHRALCKVVTKKMRKTGTDHIYREAYNVTDHEQWKQIRFKNMTVCEEMLGRPMEAYEKEMFLYPRACETCHETTPEKLHTCHSCHSVSYCRDAHLPKTHAKFCKDLRLLVDIQCYQNEHGVCDPALPDKMFAEYEILPSNIREFLVVSMFGPEKAFNMGNVELAVMAENASYPLTLLYALQNIPVAEEAHISALTELTIHVVGAEFSAECDTIAKWDVFLLNILPRLQKLHVVFIGPELEIGPDGKPGITEEDFTCEPCLRAGKKFTCEFQPNTYYHTYCRSPQFRPPHAVCAFNAGIYRTTGHGRRDSWRETIPYLVPPAVPLVVTAYTMLECPQDVARIQQEQKVDVLLPPTKNSYRSTRPAQNFLNEHENPLIYKNQYVACLMASRGRK